MAIEEMRRVRFDESSNEVHDYIPWVQNPYELFPHEDSESFVIPEVVSQDQALRGKRK